MKIMDFLSEFELEHFPRNGALMSLENHDPQFSKSQLRSMAKAGIIALDESTWTYRLTQKAYEKVTQ